MTGLSRREQDVAGLAAVTQALRTAERQVAAAREAHDLAVSQARSLANHARELAWGPGGAVVVEDPFQAHLRCAEAGQDVRASVLSMTAGWSIDDTPQMHEAFMESLELDRQAIERGVSLRTIANRVVARNPANRNYTRTAVENGDDVRFGDVVAPLLVADDLVVLPLQESGPSGALFVESPELARVMRSYFELAWAASTPFVPDSPLSETDRLVLELLVGGVQDEAIARRADLSVRTVRRRITALMERAGVSTRFQLGMAARGLLDG